MKLFKRDGQRYKHSTADHLHKNKTRYIIIISVIMLIIICIVAAFYIKTRLDKDYTDVSDITTVQQSSYTADIAPAPLPKPSIPPCFQEGKSVYQRGVANNKFGMYMVVDSSTLPLDRQMKEIAGIVNSNGGDWGYVIIHRNDLNHGEKYLKFWDEFFALSHHYHLIPIIQIVTYTFTMESLIADLEFSANFYNNFDWPSSCRIFVIYNETNARDFWGGDINPEMYAEILNRAIDIFKNVNPNYFILNGGFNASSRTGPNYLDEETYLIRMNEKIPGIFSKLDGWSTHAYPQPEFSGDYHNPPSWYGVRDQIASYQWELELLKNHFGIAGLPVFITEGGWAHKEGNQPKWQYKPASLTATYFKDAFENVWLPDPRIVSINPFIFNLEAFSNFNWMNSDGYCYPQCDVVKNIPKTAGSPQK